MNECQNGGTMIWDPVKPFNCVCKKGYEGAICKNGINIIIFINMKVNVFDWKAYITPTLQQSHRSFVTKSF